MIDVKELHIGAHVDVKISDLIEHKRVRICRTNDDNEVCYRRANDKGLLTAYAYHLEPIPLTAELLTEIGFVCRPRELAKDRVKNFFIDAESAKIMEENRLCFPQIELSYYSEIGEPELWRVRILCDNKSSFSNANLTTEAEITVRYLHELEGFVYMTLGKELIEERYGNSTNLFSYNRSTTYHKRREVIWEHL